jgi:hypothetical protein
VSPSLTRISLILKSYSTASGRNIGGDGGVRDQQQRRCGDGWVGGFQPKKHSRDLASRAFFQAATLPTSESDIARPPEARHSTFILESRLLHEPLPIHVTNETNLKVECRGCTGVI